MFLELTRRSSQQKTDESVILFAAPSKAFISFEQCEEIFDEITALSEAFISSEPAGDISDEIFAPSDAFISSKPSDDISDEIFAPSEAFISSEPAGDISDEIFAPSEAFISSKPSENISYEIFAPSEAFISSEPSGDISDEIAAPSEAFISSKPSENSSNEIAAPSKVLVSSEPSENSSNEIAAPSDAVEPYAAELDGTSKIIVKDVARRSTSSSSFKLVDSDIRKLSILDPAASVSTLNAMLSLYFNSIPAVNASSKSDYIAPATLSLALEENDANDVTLTSTVRDSDPTLKVNIDQSQTTQEITGVLNDVQTLTIDKHAEERPIIPTLKENLVTSSGWKPNVIQRSSSVFSFVEELKDPVTRVESHEMPFDDAFSWKQRPVIQLQGPDTMTKRLVVRQPFIARKNDDSFLDEIKVCPRKGNGIQIQPSSLTFDDIEMVSSSSEAVIEHLPDRKGNHNVAQLPLMTFSQRRNPHRRGSNLR